MMAPNRRKSDHYNLHRAHAMTCLDEADEAARQEGAALQVVATLARAIVLALADVADTIREASLVEGDRPRDGP